MPLASGGESDWSALNVTDATLVRGIAFQVLPNLCKHLLSVSPVTAKDSGNVLSTCFQFPPTSLRPGNSVRTSGHVVTLTLKRCAHLCRASKDMTGVTGKIEGAKVADGGGRRGPVESQRLGRGQEGVLFIGFSTSQHAPGLSITPHLAQGRRRAETGRGSVGSVGRSSAKNPSQINHMILLDYRGGGNICHG